MIFIVKTFSPWLVFFTKHFNAHCVSPIQTFVRCYFLSCYRRLGLELTTFQVRDERNDHFVESYLPVLLFVKMGPCGVV
jgi:hypothetical protein